MSKEGLHRLPAKDPVTGSELYVSELTSAETGITIRGKFELPVFSKLDADQLHFLMTFLRCKGMINAMERELNISYPTVKSRLEGVLEALSITPVKEDTARRNNNVEKKREILARLEQGEINAEEAKEQLRVQL